ncbi:MAG TPA: response regulator [Mucilaginibacter sp.]|jgi:two-component SAPR family response regulator
MDCNNLPAGTNILVIEDDYLSFFICEKLIKKVMKDTGVTACSNGKCAIDKLIEIKNKDINLLPDYIFLDITMPIMNGWEFLERYTDLNIDPSGKCKIYILTSSLFPSDARKSASYDIIQDYIVKPLDFEKLKKIFIAVS